MLLRRKVIGVGSSVIGAGSTAGIGWVPLSASQMPPTLVGMGYAQRKDEVCTAEIIYLVIPQTAPTKHRSRAGAFIEEARRSLSALSGALSLCALAIVALYGLYYVKSMAGVDLIADKHLEDFVPIPGYHRW